MPDESRVKPQPLQPEELKASDMGSLANEFVSQKKAEGERPSWDLIKWAFVKGGVARSKMIYDWLSQDVSGIEVDEGYVRLADVLEAIPNTGDDSLWFKGEEWQRLFATIEEARREQPVRVTDEMARKIWRGIRDLGYDLTPLSEVPEPDLRAFVEIITRALADSPKGGTVRNEAWFRAAGFRGSAAAKEGEE